MQNSVAKKLFAVGSAVALTLAMLAPFAAQAQAHAAGTNVASSDGTVWMIMPDGTRRAYTSAGAFLSYGFNSWSQVVPANADDLALPQGSFIPPQDGSIICSNKGSDMGTCYEISNSQKFGFTSAAVFTGLGFSFANSMPGDVSWMTMGAQLINSSVMAHLPGTLINNNGTVQLVGTSGLLGIPDLATFNSWGYSFGKVVPANAADKTMTQNGVMSARTPGQLSPTALASTGTTCTTNCGTSTVVSGNVTASLASDNPAAGTLVSATNGPGQTSADLAHFMFSGSGTVTQIVINRIGVSADTSVNNVYLYNGNNRITDAGTLSNGVVTFSNSNGLFTVSGTYEVSVRIDVATGVSGQTIGAQLASYAVANGTPMTTSLSGNLFTIAEVSNLATVTIPASTSITSSGANNGNAGTINAGTSNAILWSAPITVGQRNVLLKYIAFKQIGSISPSAINNIQLLVDGTAVGATASISNSGSNTNVVIFDLTGNPVTLQTGGHTLQLNGNIVSGTSYNYNFTLQTAADAVFYDTNYNVNVPFTYTGGTQIFQLSPGTTTINAGTVSIQQDPTFTSTQFVTNQPQVDLGQWTMQAYGEDVKVQNLQVVINYTGTPTSAEGFNNLSLYINGGQVGSSLSALGNGSGTSFTYTFGSTNLFTIPAGTTVTLAVKGDSTFISGSAVTAVQANLVTPTNSLQGATSFTLFPSSALTYTGTTLTTSSSSATMSKNAAYTNQALSTNTTKQHIGSYVIQAGSSDGVRVSQLTVGLATSTIPLTDLANLYIVTPAGSSTPVSPQTNNTFSTNFTVPANTTASVDVYADVGNPTSASNSTEATITPSVTTPNGGAAAASGFVNLTGYWDNTNSVSVTINGFPSVFTSTGASTTNVTMAAGLLAAINANTNVNGTVVATASSTTGVTITAKTAGTAGNSITLAASSTVSGGATGAVVKSGTALANGSAGTAQVENYAIAGTPTVGNVYTVVINGTTVTYTDTAGTVAGDVAGLVTAINTAVAGVTATNSNPSVVVTANVAGTAFTVGSASVALGTHSGSGFTVVTALSGTGTGVASNQAVTLAQQQGQTITVGTGSLSSVVLSVAASPLSSYVNGNTNGQPIATYNFVANTTGQVTITELGFTASSTNSGPISGVSVPMNGISGTAANGTIVGTSVIITGLSIVVPVGNGGLNVPVTVNYSPVGVNGVHDQAVQLILSHVKYLAGGTTTVNNDTAVNGSGSFGSGATGIIGSTGVSANVMELVGSSPTLSVASTNNAGLATSQQNLINVTVSPSTAGNVQLNQLAFLVSASGITSPTLGVSASSTLDIGSNVVNGATCSQSGTSLNATTVTVTCTLPGNYILQSGTPITFSLYGTIGGTLGNAGTSSVTVSLAPASNFSWTDISGDNTVFTTQNSTYLQNYPTQSWYLHN